MKRARTKLASQRRTHRARWFGLLALIVLLGACGEAHVVRREPGYEAPARETSAVRHVGMGEVEVIRGDTLYGIAFRNGMDFRDLAAINGIDPPYTIYVGQVLKLRGEHVQAASHPMRVTPQATAVPVTRPVANAQNTAPVPVHTQAQTAPTPFETVPSAASAPAPTSPTPAPSSPAHPMPSAPTQPAPVPSAQVQPQPAPRAAPAPVVAQTPSAAILPAVIAPVGGVGWRWPAKGTLLDRFMAGDATKQGIDIGGNAGDPVFAASDGVVVYSGSGLVGYGELIIIKHSDEWLSAYGHNRKRLVQEGQRVKAGQPIAEMGSTGANRDMLHFEIRRNGRPVDPLQYLPGR
jgi:lipoprotein NlpD